MSRFPLSRLLSVAIIIAPVLTGCSTPPRIVSEYKIDIQQGNVLTQEMVSLLKPGQTRDQVRYLLGTPMITDVFHLNRWDYVYRFQNGATGQVESRRFSVFFDQSGLLERIDGDVEVASVGDLTAPVARSRVVDLGTLPEGEAGKLPPPEGPGFFRRLINWIGF